MRLQFIGRPDLRRPYLGEEIAILCGQRESFATAHINGAPSLDVPANSRRCASRTAVWTYRPSSASRHRTIARKHNVGAGIHFIGDVAEQVRFLEMGANLLIHSADIVLVSKHRKKYLGAIRKIVGEQRRDDQLI